MTSIRVKVLNNNKALVLKAINWSVNENGLLVVETEINGEKYKSVFADGQWEYLIENPISHVVV